MDSLCAVFVKYIFEVNIIVLYLMGFIPQIGVEYETAVNLVCSVRPSSAVAGRANRAGSRIPCTHKRSDGPSRAHTQRPPHPTGIGMMVAGAMVPNGDEVSSTLQIV